MRLEQRKHANLLAELTILLSTQEMRLEVGKSLFRQLLITYPHFMKMYKPLQSLTLPQALNSDYLTTLSMKYVQNLLELVQIFNDEDSLSQKIITLSNVHKNCGLTVAHFLSVVPIFTDTLAFYLKIQENKESMQYILSTICSLIGKRL